LAAEFISFWGSSSDGQFHGAFVRFDFGSRLYACAYLGPQDDHFGPFRYGTPSRDGGTVGNFSYFRHFYFIDFTCNNVIVSLRSLPQQVFFFCAMIRNAFSRFRPPSPSSSYVVVTIELYSSRRCRPLRCFALVGGRLLALAGWLVERSRRLPGSKSGDQVEERRTGRRMYVFRSGESFRRSL